MEGFILNPGLKHLAENIFLYLDYEDIIICQLVNESWNGFLENPMFWLKKWTRRGLSKKNQIAWRKAIQLTGKNIEIEENIVLYMKTILKRKICMDIPCHIYEKSIEKFLKIRESKGTLEIFPLEINNDTLGSIQLLAQENYDQIELCKKIHQAVIGNNNKLVKILTPLVEDPNVYNIGGCTPIQSAVFEENLEIIKILAPLTDNPNRTSTENRGVFTKYNPIFIATGLDNLEIIKVLAPLVYDPNEPNSNGITPIWFAAGEGNKEIVKFLVPLSEFPNAPSTSPDALGLTPIQIANAFGYQDIVKLLRPFEGKIQRKNNVRKQLQAFELFFGIFLILFLMLFGFL